MHGSEEDETWIEIWPEVPEGKGREFWFLALRMKNAKMVWGKYRSREEATTDAKRWRFPIVYGRSDL